MKLCFRDCNRSRVVSTYLYDAFDCMLLSVELVFLTLKDHNIKTESAIQPMLYYFQPIRL